MTSSHRRSPRFLVAALAALAAALVPLVLEGGIRVAGRLRGGSWPQTAEARFRAELDEALELYRLHPYLNTAPVGGASVHAFGKQASFNSLGYRSPERPLANRAGKIRIVCAGGSTTFDLLAPSDAATWPARLEVDLRGRGLPAEVWNAGFPGWTSLENVISLEIRDLDLQPDVVVLFQGVNDLQPATHQPFDAQYERGHAEISRRALGFELPPLRWIDRSLAAELLRDGMRGPRDPWQRLAPPRGASLRRRRIAPGAVAAFERNVRSFIAVATSAGAKVLLVTQTIHPRRLQATADRRYLEQWYPDLVAAAAPGDLARLNEVLRRLHQPTGSVRTLDAGDAPWQDEDFGDPLHFSPRGSARMAGLVASALAGEGGLLARP